MSSAPLDDDVYAELRRIASRMMSGERVEHTLSPTALVHEAWLRISRGSALTGLTREHFIGLAAQAMRHALVDHARRRSALKRETPSTLTGDGVVDDRDLYLLSLDQALDALREEDKELARIVELRFFVGMTNDEIGELLGSSGRTIKRRWRFAKSWLHHWITEGEES